MKNKEDRKFLLSSLLGLIPLFIGLVFYNSLPDTLPTHFNFAGEPDDYSSKIFAVIGLPIFMMAMDLFVKFILIKDPKEKGHSKKLKIFFSFFIPILTLVIVCITIAIGLGKNINPTKLITILISITFIVIGNYIPKCKQNYTMGVKTPWTLADEEIWTKTHRLAGPIFVIGGIILLLSSMFTPLDTLQSAIFFGVFIAIICVPSIYSYLLFKKKNES
ncbi:MAG: SdpI family protein [Lachnospirales bacterium]